jgi:hypothetical protein
MKNGPLMEGCKNGGLFRHGKKKIFGDVEQISRKGAKTQRKTQKVRSLRLCAFA